MPLTTYIATIYMEAFTPLVTTEIAYCPFVKARCFCEGVKASLFATITLVRAFVVLAPFPLSVFHINTPLMFNQTILLFPLPLPFL